VARSDAACRELSYAIDQAIWGPAPFGFHLTSVLLHMINVGLFALLIWGRRRSDRAKGTRILRAPGRRRGLAWRREADRWSG
jgi:hypothetical protein